MFTSLDWNPLKRFYKFVLKRVIGRFLKGELDPNQLDVQLTRGVLELSNLELDVDVLNQITEDLPLTFTRAHIRRVTATIPWKNILRDPCSVLVEGVTLVAIPSCQQPKPSMTGSLLAESFHDLSRAELREKIRLHRNLQRDLMTGKDEETLAPPEVAVAAGTTGGEDVEASESAEAEQDDGLQVVASFLEQVISRTELEGQDIVLRIEHQSVLSVHQRVVFVLRLPWLRYTSAEEDHPSFRFRDASDPQQAQQPQPQNETQRAAPERLGPRLEYYKAVRFRGFRVEMFEVGAHAHGKRQSGAGHHHVLEDPVQAEIARSRALASPTVSAARSRGGRVVPDSRYTVVLGDMDQDCIIYVKVLMNASAAMAADVLSSSNADAAAGAAAAVVSGRTFVDFSCFIRSVRALLSPHQLGLLVELLCTVGRSSSEVAERARRLREEEKTRAEAKAAAVSESSSPDSIPSRPLPVAQPSRRTQESVNGPVPLSAGDVGVIEDLLQHLGVSEAADFPSTLARNAEYFELGPANDLPVVGVSSSELLLENDDSGGSAEGVASFMLWSLKCQLLDCSLVLLEHDDAPWPHKWWLSPVNLSTDNANANNPTERAFFHPDIPGVQSDHLLLRVRNTVLAFSQSSSHAAARISMGQVDVFEYLLAHRCLGAASATSSQSQSPSPAITQSLVCHGCRRAGRRAAPDEAPLFHRHRLVGFDSEGEESMPQGKQQLTLDDDDAKSDAGPRSEALHPSFRRHRDQVLKPHFICRMRSLMPDAASKAWKARHRRRVMALRGACGNEYHACGGDGDGDGDRSSEDGDEEEWYTQLVALQFQPMQIDLDLGALERLSLLFAAVGAAMSAESDDNSKQQMAPSATQLNRLSSGVSESLDSLASGSLTGGGHSESDVGSPGMSGVPPGARQTFSSSHTHGECSSSGDGDATVPVFRQYVSLLALEVRLRLFFPDVSSVSRSSLAPSGRTPSISAAASPLFTSRESASDAGVSTSTSTSEWRDMRGPQLRECITLSLRLAKAHTCLGQGVGSDSAWELGFSEMRAFLTYLPSGGACGAEPQRQTHQYQSNKGNVAAPLLTQCVLVARELPESARSQPSYLTSMPAEFGPRRRKRGSLGPILPVVHILIRAPPAAAGGCDDERGLGAAAGKQEYRPFDGSEMFGAGTAGKTLSNTAFFHGLPSFRVWEPAETSEKHAGDEGNQSPPFFSAPSSSRELPTQQEFQQLCVSGSQYLVSLFLPCCCVSLSKTEYDTLMFLYTYALELLERAQSQQQEPQQPDVTDVSEKRAEMEEETRPPKAPAREQDKGRRESESEKESSSTSHHQAHEEEPSPLQLPAQLLSVPAIEVESGDGEAVMAAFPENFQADAGLDTSSADINARLAASLANLSVFEDDNVHASGLPSLADFKYVDADVLASLDDDDDDDESITGAGSSGSDAVLSHQPLEREDAGSVQVSLPAPLAALAEEKEGKEQVREPLDDDSDGQDLGSTMFLSAVAEAHEELPSPIQNVGDEGLQTMLGLSTVPDRRLVEGSWHSGSDEEQKEEMDDEQKQEPVVSSAPMPVAEAEELQESVVASASPADSNDDEESFAEESHDDEYSEEDEDEDEDDDDTSSLEESGYEEEEDMEESGDEVKTAISASAISSNYSSPFRHLLSLRLCIQQGSVVLTEDHTTARVAAVMAAKDPRLRQQQERQHGNALHGFLLELDSVHAFQVVFFEGRPITYLTLGAGGVCMREYDRAVTDPDELVRVPSLALMFNTMVSARKNTGMRKAFALSPPDYGHLRGRDSQNLLPPPPDPEDLVFVLSLVITQRPTELLRDILAVVNLRALTLNYVVSSDWIMKLTDFFTVAPPAVGSAFAGPQPQAQMPSGQGIGAVEDVVKLFVNGYDVTLDYNPHGVPARLCLVFEHFRLSTNIVQGSPILAFKIGLRDGAAYLCRHDLPQPSVLPPPRACSWPWLRDLFPCSSRLQLEENEGPVHAAVASQGMALGRPFLHLVEGDVLFDYLERAGFVRVATLDFLEAFVKNTPRPPSSQFQLPFVDTSTTITNGLLCVFTCSDSFAKLFEIIGCFTEELGSVQQQKEVTVSFPPVSPPDSSSQRVDHDEKERKEHRDGADEEGGDSDESADARPLTVHLGCIVDSKPSAPASASPPRREKPRDGASMNLFDGLDENMFGLDAERAPPPPSVPKLPPQALRTLAHRNRNRRTNAAAAGSRHIQFIDDYLEDEDSENAAAEDAERGSLHGSTGALSRPKAVRRKSAPISPSSQEQQARWYGSDEVQRAHSSSVRARGRAPRSPTLGPSRVIEDHVMLPDDESATADLSSLQDEIRDTELVYPPPLSQIVFRDVNVRWRCFGGLDWPPENEDRKEAKEAGEDEKKGLDATVFAADLSDAQHVAAVSQRAREALSWSGPADPSLGEHVYALHPGQSPKSELKSDEDKLSSAEEKSGSAAREPGIDYFGSYTAGAAVTVDRGRRLSHPLLPSAAEVPPLAPGVLQTAPQQVWGRDLSKVLDFMLSGATFRFEGFEESDILRLQQEVRKAPDMPPSSPSDIAPEKPPVRGVSTFRIAIAIREAEIHDHVATSPYKKALCYYRQPQQRGLRPLNSCMFRMEQNSVRPDPSQPLREEYRLRMEFLPLALNVDQDTLEFLIEFFAGKGPEDGDSAAAEEGPDHDDGSQGGSHAAEEKKAESSYFEWFSTNGLRMCIDYTPKRVNYQRLRDGDYVQLVHLFPLEQVEIDLKPIQLAGIVGWERLLAEVGTYWASDISKRQVHRYLSGVQPIRSLVNVGSGVADLVLVPLTEYSKGPRPNLGRFLRGIKKGGSSFLRAVATETVDVTARLAAGAQSALESVESLFSVEEDQVLAANAVVRAPGRRLPVHQGAGGPRESSSLAAAAAHPGVSRRRRSLHRYANQPKNYREGLQQAYESLARGMQVVAHNMVVVPSEEFSRSGTRAGVRSVLRAVPGALLRPMIFSTEALSKILMGVQNAVQPGRKLAMDDKYKDNEHT